MTIKKYETNYKKMKFLKETEEKAFEKAFDKKENNMVVLYPEFEYQTIIGFGGAITNSSAEVFYKLSEESQKAFIKDYFSAEGLNYNFCRTHINSCDFSTKTYSYSEKESLADFSIDVDKEKLIPLIKLAQNENSKIKFLATPWSPPKFMKTNESMVLGGKLKPEHKETWAKYIVKYFDEYKKEGIHFEYMTVQNEANAKQLWESCIFTADEEADFAINYLIPNLRINKYNTKVLCWDHNKERLYYRANDIYEQDKDNLIAGLGYHYYTGDHFGNLEVVSEKYPDKLLIHTEGCCGFSFKRRSRQIPNAEIYAHDIIGDLNSGSNGYIDWNILLDFKGGPNHVLNNCYAPILASFTGKKYKKNLVYYYLGHFSKFIKEGAKRIKISKYTENLEITAFKNVDKTIVVVIMNKTDKARRINLVLDRKNYSDVIDKHSIVTLKI